MEAIGLRAPGFAGHCNARGMDEISFYIARPQTTCQPEAVTTSLISDDNAFDCANPAEVSAVPLLRIELLKGLAFDAGERALPISGWPERMLAEFGAQGSSLE